MRGRPEVLPRERSLAQLAARFGERDWYGSLLDADLLTAMLADDPAEPLRQRTHEIVRRWLNEHAVTDDAVDVAVLVSNTLWSAAEDFLSDLGSLGLAGLIDGVVTSHSVGYRKPHPAIFEGALAIVGVRARDAVMVGDEPYQDVFGAQRLGMRAVWLRPPEPRPIPVGEPDGFAVTPDARIESLAELPEVLERWLR